VGSGRPIRRHNGTASWSSTGRPAFMVSAGYRRALTTLRQWGRHSEQLESGRERRSARAATTRKRKIFDEVANKYIGSTLCRLRLPSQGHADGGAVPAIVVVNTAGCASESSMGELPKMPKTATHTSMGKWLPPVTVYVG
jgi:hypothetical protein